MEQWHTLETTPDVFEKARQAHRRPGEALLEKLRLEDAEAALANPIETRNDDDPEVPLVETRGQVPDGGPSDPSRDMAQRLLRGLRAHSIKPKGSS